MLENRIELINKPIRYKMQHINNFSKSMLVAVLKFKMVLIILTRKKKVRSKPVFFKNKFAVMNKTKIKCDERTIIFLQLKNLFPL